MWRSRVSSGAGSSNVCLSEPVTCTKEASGLQFTRSICCFVCWRRVESLPSSLSSNAWSLSSCPLARVFRTYETLWKNREWKFPNTILYYTFSTTNKSLASPWFGHPSIHHGSARWHTQYQLQHTLFYKTTIYYTVVYIILTRLKN
jgi:hypothetical protein